MIGTLKNTGESPEKSRLYALTEVWSDEYVSGS